MTPDDLYAELEAIAKKHIGPLDTQAVRHAPTILALPRYEEADDGPALLVADLKHVIGAIPNDPARSTRDRPWSSVNFGTYAKRFFSIEAAGEGYTDRISFRGQSDPSGSVGPWMRRGVLYRVAAGLLELWASTPHASLAVDATPSQLGFVVDSVLVRHETFMVSRSIRFADHFTYELRMLTSGPHVLLLPFAARHGHLDTGNGLDQQLVSILSGGKHTAAIVFGAQGQPQEPVRLLVTHKPPPSRGTETSVYSVTFDVSQAIGRLVLAMITSSAPTGQYQWRVAGPGTDLPLAMPVTDHDGLFNSWDNPVPGTYRIYPFPETVQI